MNFPIKNITTRRDESRRATVVTIEYLVRDDAEFHMSLNRPIYSMLDFVFKEIIPALDAEECASMIAACAARRMEGGQ